MSGNQGGGIGKILTTGIIHVPGVNSGGVVGPDRTPKLPSLIKPIENVKPLPTIDDAAVKAARNNKLVDLQKSSGRASTLLSGTQGTKTTFG